MHQMLHSHGKLACFNLPVEKYTLLPMGKSKTFQLLLNWTKLFSLRALNLNYKYVLLPGLCHVKASPIIYKLLCELVVKQHCEILMLGQLMTASHLTHQDHGVHVCQHCLGRKGRDGGCC